MAVGRVWLQVPGIEMAGARPQSSKKIARLLSRPDATPPDWPSTRAATMPGTLMPMRANPPALSKLTSRKSCSMNDSCGIPPEMNRTSLCLFATATFCTGYFCSVAFCWQSAFKPRSSADRGLYHTRKRPLLQLPRFQIHEIRAAPHPRSASSVSPGPFTRQPMTAIVMAWSFRWAVHLFDLLGQVDEGLVSRPASNWGN